MSGFQVQPRDADIDMAQLFGALWRDKLRIVLGAIIITVLAALALSFVSPRYSAETKIIINANESSFTRPISDGQGGNGNNAVDLESVASEAEVLTSSDLLLKVAAELNLAKLTEFNDEAESSFIKDSLVSLGLIADPDLTADQRVLAKIREKLSVYAVENSRVINIEFSSRDRELAAKFPNTLAKIYAESGSAEQLGTTGVAIEFLEQEIARLETGVRNADAKVAAFRGSAGLLISSNDETLAIQQMAEISTELSNVRAERASIEARVQSVEAALRNGAALDTQPDVIASPLIGRLREREVALNADIADLSTTLLPGHPRIKALRSQLDDLSNQIREQARNVLTSLRTQVQIERERELDLERSLNAAKAETSLANENGVELAALERDAEAQRAVLEDYQVRYREARARAASDYAPANANIFSTAKVPAEPSFPKMIPLLIAIFVGSLLLMCLFSLMRALLSGRALVPAGAATTSSQTVAQAPPVVTSNGTQVNVGEVDELPAKPMAAFKNVESSAPANDNFSIESLTRDLIQKGAGRAIVISPEGDAGSMCSVGLARATVDKGLRVVLVDLTGTGASSQHMLDDFSLPGITDLLTSAASYSDVIHSDAATSAHIVPVGAADPLDASRSIDRLPIILNALSSAYDLVIIDCGPTDASGLARLQTDDAEIVLAMVEPDSNQIVRAAEDLVEGGYNDVLIVTADTIPAPLPPHSSKSFG